MKTKRYVTLALGAAMLPLTAVMAATNTYTGPLNASSSWNNDANWSLGTKPTATDDVVMSQVGGYSNVNAAFTINSLNIAAASSGFSYVYLQGNSLTSGTISIGSNVAGTNSFLQLTGGGAVVSTGSLVMGGTQQSEIRLFSIGGNSTLNVGGGTGTISNTGTGAALLTIAGTGVSVNASSVNVDQLNFGSSPNSSGLSINSGQAYNVSSAVNIGYNAGSGLTQTLTVNGGTLTTSSVNLNADSSSSNAKVNLNGGTLSANTIQRANAGTTQEFTWNDGTIANNAAGGALYIRGSSGNDLVIALSGNGTHTLDITGASPFIHQETTSVFQDKAGEQGTLVVTSSDDLVGATGNVYLQSVNTYTGSTTIKNATAYTGPGDRQVLLDAEVLANGGVASSIGASSNAAANLIMDGGALRYRGSVNATTDRNFTVTEKGGGFRNTGNGTLTITGNATMSGVGDRVMQFNAGTTQGDNEFAGSMGDPTSGVTTVYKGGAGTWIFSGQNTYTGNTTVDSGQLILADNSQTAFEIGASGVNNMLNGVGSVTIDGDFVFDLSGAADTGTWNIVDVGSLTETFGATFSVVGFTDNLNNTWSFLDGVTTYTFSETTGNLTAVPEPSTWMLLGTGALTIALMVRRRRAAQTE